MAGMTLRDRVSGIAGMVDAVSAQPDGTAIARIADRWFDAAALVAV